MLAYREAWKHGASMYEVVKRKGSFTESLPVAPVFDDQADAEQWARAFLEGHPERFARGLEAIEVRRARLTAS
jgi:hypothetical protein